MAYRLKLKEPLAKGVRRIASEQLANAAARLQGESDGGRAVHEARKSLKRTRALLRLVRPGLGESQFRTSNEALRDIARTLSAARDRDVVRAHLAGLGTEKRSVQKAAAHLIAILDAAPAAGAKPDDMARHLADTVAAIEAVRRDITEIGLHPASFATVVSGLARSHRQGRRALALALDNPGEEEPLHDLRKAAQAHWRQMILVQQAWPEVCLARAAAAKLVADLLGRDHDIALLDAVLAGPEGAALTRSERTALSRYCEARHAEFRSVALPKAQLLFAERSARVAERMGHLWDIAKRAAQARPRTVAANEATGASKPS
jgi:CHAD domain-containing protein